jgi:GMP synthase-like glutamine amidotransferase
MKILLIDNGTSILQKLQKLAGSDEITKKWNDVLPSDATSYDLIILSGSSQYSVNQNYDLFAKEIELIRSTRIPLIGICFGCELIAHAFGGKLGDLKEKHHGIREISFLGADISSKKKIKVYENHQAIITAMPKDFTVVASSEDGPEMIRHTSLPIFGLQFHPENFVDETEGDEVFFVIIRSLTLPA